MTLPKVTFRACFFFFLVLARDRIEHRAFCPAGSMCYYIDTKKVRSLYVPMSALTRFPSAVGIVTPSKERQTLMMR